MQNNDKYTYVTFVPKRLKKCAAAAFLATQEIGIEIGF